jgi:curli biogenesis system outer membrane secretion channel CsgG
VAILDYEVTVPDSAALGPQIADILTARLSGEDAFQLVERAKLGKILEEQKLKLAGLADQEKAVEVGKLLGAQLMVIGKAFPMDKRLVFVTKVVGVETGRVKGTIRTVEASKAMSEAILEVGDDVAGLIRKEGPSLLPESAVLADPIAEIRKALGDRPRPSVAVIVPERHLTRVIVDPAAETEIKRTLVECGFTVVDTGKNDLADWAKKLAQGERPPWPAAIQDADVVVVGEAFSEFALRTGDLVTCTARAEINAIDRHSGRILAADRDTQRAVDLSEATAGKTALQKAGRRIALNLCRTLVGYKMPEEKKAAEPKPPAKAAQPGGSSQASPGRVQSGPPLVLAAPLPQEQQGDATQAAAPAAPAQVVSTTTAMAGAKARPAAKRTIFPAPLENETGQEQYDPAAAGLSDLVAVLLAQQENVAVVERQRLEALTAEQAASLKGLTGGKYAIQAGKLLKADTVLTGRLFLIQGKLTVSLQAIDIVSERVMAADQMAFRAEDVVETALQLARKLGQQMSLPLPEINLKDIDKSPLASLHFAKALGDYYAGNMDAAIMQFMRTIDLDPDYTEALFWSGMAYQRLGEHDHAAIEWEAYLKREPDSKRAEAVRKLLAEAKAKDTRSSNERLGPDGAPSKAAPAPAAQATPPSAPKPAAAPATPSDPEKVAQNRLQLAEMLEKAGKADAARKEYGRIVEQYPGTKAAETAKQKLKALQPLDSNPKP